MPGHAPEDDRSGIVFQDYVDKISLPVLRAQTEPVVLVGHSSAGYMIQAAAPLAADKLERLVFHNAFVLPDKTAQFDLVPAPIAQGMTSAGQSLAGQLRSGRRRLHPGRAHGRRVPRRSRTS